jgi:hypothetical protein
MPFTDWKEWATGQSERIYENVGDAFKKFLEQEWKDALNVAAAEPSFEIEARMDSFFFAAVPTLLSRSSMYKFFVTNQE